MQFHVLGLGPVGCLLAHNLRRILPTTSSISLILKNAEEQRILQEKSAIELEYHGVTTRASGFITEAFQGDTQPSLVPYSRRNSGHETTDRIDSLFVTLKAHQTINAIRGLAPRLSSNSTIVLMQNGMGVYEHIVHEIFRNPEQRPHFILASNTHGSYLSKPFHAIHAGVGEVNFGIVPDAHGRDFEAGFNEQVLEKRRLRLSDITSPTDSDHSRYTSLRNTAAALLLLEPLNPSWKIYSELQLLMKRKLVVNAFINPLTALLGCRNGLILEEKYGQDILTQVCQEAHTIFAAQVEVEAKNWLSALKVQGIDVADITVPTYPRALTALSLQEEVLRVVDVTKGNVSSMLQDIQSGRPTEIDYINGYIRNLGRDYGIPTPVNTTLYNLVKMRFRVPLDRIM